MRFTGFQIILINFQILRFTVEQKIHYSLRIVCAMCFIGHGAFGIIGKEIWTNYFAVFGIGHDTAFRLMPYVGTIDILCGIIILFYPLRAVVLWLVIWGTITALLRPLSGEPFAEFIERAGNFAAPLALLILSGGINMKNIFISISPYAFPKEKSWYNLRLCLQIAAFLLLFGHGWLNLIDKNSLLNEYRLLGFDNPAQTALAVGLFEILGAISILIRSLRSVVLFFFIWKMASELLYPHYELFEFIERGGSYGILLAMWFTLEVVPVVKRKNVSSFVNCFLLNNKRE